MLLFGHSFIKNRSFYHTSSIDAIKNTPPSSTLFIEFSEANLDIIKHMQENELSFALSVTSIEELIYACALGASFILVQTDMAKSAQNIAETYLFDAKVLVQIESDTEIQEMALLGIDGVYYSSAIIKINS